MKPKFWTLLVIALLTMALSACGGSDDASDSDDDGDISIDGDMNQTDGDFEDNTCYPQCGDKECGSDGCSGSCGTCDTPPDPYCASPNTLRSYAQVGSCIVGYCDYATNDTPCDFGCVDGACTDCVGSCEGFECGDDGCGGSCGLCNQPPAPTCITPYLLRTYDSPGSCAAGLCTYAYTDTPCEDGCEGGICLGCVPSCEGNECGSDGCGGTCGTCNQPPEPICITINTQRTYDSLGTCVAGDCQYGYVDFNCEFGCEGGVCQGCQPNCEGRECGDDGCGGVCGRCDDPPDNECLGGNSLAIYPPTGTCDFGTCRYPRETIECEFGCSGGMCEGCTPDCGGKECGPYDGCGGNCGTCSGLEYCTDQGMCDCLNPDSCSGTCCEIGDICYMGSCCTPATQCPADVCGSWVDSCGEAHACGDCSNGYDCVNNSCQCINNRVECGSLCCQDGDVCYDGSCCTPGCNGAECGPGNCGESCGTCGPNSICDADGQCACTYLECGGECCGDGQVCGPGGTCCSPDCDGKECGPDGCGGSCGECAANEECSGDGLCDCIYQGCGDLCCAEGQVCNASNACCTPNCEGKECGDNGCDGVCGECGDNEECVEGTCETLDPCLGPCDPATDASFCMNDLAELCICDEDSSQWTTYVCDTICSEDPLYYYGYCGEGEDSNSICLCSDVPEGNCKMDRDCPPEAPICVYFEEDGTYCGECVSDDDCIAGGSDGCVVSTNDQDQTTTICYDACEVSICDPGTDEIGCVDFGAPGGLCMDFAAADCDTADQSCIDEEHWCQSFEGDLYCWEECTPVTNTCTGGLLCQPVYSGSTGKIIEGGCF